MLSLTVILAIMITAFVAHAWAVARGARAVGSPRATFRYAVLAKIYFLLASVVLVWLVYLIRSFDLKVQLFLLGCIFLLSIIIEVSIYSRVFWLTLGDGLRPFVYGFGISIVYGAISYFVVKPYMMDSFVMPTSGMAPTIDKGDAFIVNKWLHARRLDLVAYKQVDPTTGETMIYCKRLIGLPGERIRFDNGTIWIDDLPANVPPVLFGRCHASYPNFVRSQNRYEDGEIITLGTREYFFIGDNTEVSGDSRLNGPSDSSALIGVVDCIYWPAKKWRIVR